MAVWGVVGWMACGFIYDAVAFYNRDEIRETPTFLNTWVLAVAWCAQAAIAIAALRVFDLLLVPARMDLN